MGECEFINSCPFFNGELEGREADIERLKTEYCQSNSLHCARYIVAIALGREKMPHNLYPDEKDRAYMIIAESE